MSFRVTWTVPMYVIEHGWARGRERFLMELDFNLSEAARNMESWARGNHVWQNRTTDAEQTFTVEYESGARKMSMGHGVPYGKFLESMQGGRFGIIPALFTYGKPVVNEALQKSLDQAYGR